MKWKFLLIGLVVFSLLNLYSKPFEKVGIETTVDGREIVFDTAVASVTTYQNLTLLSIEGRNRKNSTYDYLRIDIHWRKSKMSIGTYSFDSSTYKKDDTSTISLIRLFEKNNDTPFESSYSTININSIDSNHIQGTFDCTVTSRYPYYRSHKITGKFNVPNKKIF